MFAEVRIEGPSYENVYVLPESVLQESGSAWVVDKGALKSVVPKTLGRAGAGWVVEAFDAGAGVVVGAPPGARKGLAVTVADVVVVKVTEPGHEHHRLWSRSCRDQGTDRLVRPEIPSPPTCCFCF